MYQVIEVGKFRQTPTKKNPYSKTQPYCMIFVIAPEGNFLLKGMHEECITYLKQRFIKYLAKYTFWKNGKERGNWIGSTGLFVKPNFNPDGSRPKRNKLQVIIITPDNPKPITLEFRHLPKKWLPIYDKSYQRW